MKTVLLLSVLATLAIGYDMVSVIKAAPWTNLIIGNVDIGDRLLDRSQIFRPPIPNMIQSEDYVYRGHNSTVITAIRAIELGPRQYAQTFIITGGLGFTNVTIRMQSRLGNGYNYLIEIWGRYRAIMG